MAYNHQKGLCWVGHKEKIIFIGIPKNASTSIRNSFGFTNSESDNYLVILKRETDEKKYKVFTVLRNPLDRFISGYIEVCKRATVDSPKTLEKKFYWMRNSKRRFLAFLDEIESDFFDAHIEPQEYYLTDRDGKLFNCDLYLIFENLQEEFRKMCKILNINITLNHDNLTPINEKNLIIRFFEDLSRISISSNFTSDTRKLFDKVKRRIMGQPIPTKKQVLSYIKENNFLRERINRLYQRDWEIYNIMINEKDITSRKKISDNTFALRAALL